MKSRLHENIKYLVVNQDDESWGLYVTTIGFQSINPGTEYPPKQHPSAYWFSPDAGRKLNEFQILYITHGEGVFESDSCKKVKLKEGSVIILFPGEWHSYKPVKNRGWDEYWIGCKGKFIEDLLSNTFISPVNPVIHIGFNETIVGLLKQGLEVATRQKTAYQQRLAGITSHLLSYVYYIEKNNAFRDKDAVMMIEKARMMMREESDQIRSPEKIAKRLNLSYSWFRRIFKQYTGLSPAQYMMEIKIQQAKDLLVGSSMPIKEIAYSLNFLNLSYFITFFKSRTGMPPGDYRNKVRGE